MLKGRFLIVVGCCLLNNVVWGQTTIAHDTLHYEINPQEVRQHFEGWGVSLCWWAGQCGKWSDEKIDEIVTWLVSPEGLNYNIFRYNIGGGDDPQNRHCEPHHMGRGKGLRAEMEGFKDSIGDRYHWERDAAQRKIMLKIKEKRPDAIFEAFSNSCPYYMTYSGCVAGHQDGGKDNLRPEYYEAFAHYLVDVCKHYKDEYGIEFKTLAPFNESASNYWHANGSQEGCHFDYESQVRFIRVLEPILRASGLSTVISAADETSVGHAIGGLKYYVSTGADRYIGQWNTHTYGGSILEKVRYGALARATDKHLWMSETGAGGNGIAGNLKLAQRLIDDMRYIQPEAWIDWQYMEEANDQWCTIRGSFADQTYAKVKNYYVRQQCSRFIKQGYDIITSGCEQSLAAISAHRDTLVIVALNESLAAKTHEIDLSRLPYKAIHSSIHAYRTSIDENLADAFESVRLDGTTLILKIPSQSITTLVIPVENQQRLVRPAALKTGDTIAIISPSSTPDSMTVVKGCQALREWGYVPVVGPHALSSYHGFAGTVDERAEDLLWALRDSTIKAIMCSRGGDGAVQVLRRIPLEEFRNHPKWVMGFSDATALHSAEVSAGVMSIHCSMCDGISMRGERDSVNVILQRLLQGEFPNYQAPAHPLNQLGEAEGILVGGNLSVLSGLAGSEYDFLNRADEGLILFIEDTGEGMSKVDRMLHQIEIRGILSKLKGIIVGHFSKYKSPENGLADMYEMFHEYFQHYDIPVCYDFPVGHHSGYNYPMVEGGRVILRVGKDETIFITVN